MTSSKTVRLARGKHHGPDSGACVVELSSMLADEAFTDRPLTACRALTAFARGYNDGLDDARRQDLYPLAAALVQSAAAEPVTEQRVEALLALAQRHPICIGRLRIPARRHALAQRFERCERAGIHLGRQVRRGQCDHQLILQTVCALTGRSSPSVVRSPDTGPRTDALTGHNMPRSTKSVTV